MEVQFFTTKCKQAVFPISDNLRLHSKGTVFGGHHFFDIQTFHRFSVTDGDLDTHSLCVLWG